MLTNSGMLPADADEMPATKKLKASTEAWATRCTERSHRVHRANDPIFLCVLCVGAPCPLWPRVCFYFLDRRSRQQSLELVDRGDAGFRHKAPGVREVNSRLPVEPRKIEARMIAVALESVAGAAAI